MINFESINAVSNKKPRVGEIVDFTDYCGSRRQFVFQNGRYIDSLMMSVLQSEYGAARTEGE